MIPIDQESYFELKPPQSDRNHYDHFFKQSDWPKTCFLHTAEKQQLQDNYF